MRLLINIGTSDIALNERSFKLQFAEKSGTCDASFTGETYADVTTSTAISFKDISELSDNTALGAASDLTNGGNTIVNQTYEESNNFTNSQSTISAGQDGKWDFSLYDNGAPASQTYCLRVVNASGSVLSAYSQLPEISTAAPATPTLEQVHARWRSDNGSEASATFDGPEDTTLSTGVYIGDRRRVRFSLANTGNASAGSYNYRIEYASGVCSAWTAVSSYGNYTTQHFTMDTSGNLVNGGATTDLAGVSNPAGTFLAGLTQTTQNQTSAFTLPANRFTELEYSLRSTENVATNTTYCFRLTNAGSITNFVYTVLPRIVILPAIQRPSGGGGGNAGGESNGTPGAPQGGGGVGSGGGSAGGESGGTPGGQQGGGGAGGGGNSE